MMSDDVKNVKKCRKENHLKSVDWKSLFISKQKKKLFIYLQKYFLCCPYRII